MGYQPCYDGMGWKAIILCSVLLPVCAIKLPQRLHRGDDPAIVLDIAVGHARSIKSPSRISVTIEKDKAAGRMRAACKDVYCRVSGGHRGFCCELGLRGQNRRGHVFIAKVAKK